ncbi:MAG TPA: di-trans,poly-cis-decaprenylcistransferase [Gallionella sp.]|jgi:undecaprenyl diphosphate synthase|nr:isoprenyl transferase [Gallionella sp.]OGS67416.1 MAG: di-trans,poly-cis-decaprenylcistransferase [Gallionellales bacterium GWA2_54_124]HCI52235.1 di-trans,poly-cis-decaprenylcistransferase [Gallionella sp.]
MTKQPSSTRAIPDVARVPRHIAIIMDGNGRWAKQRFMPRIMGHQRGVESLRAAVRACRDLGVQYLTVFAFSSENWRRPVDEVSFLMSLFLKMLEREVASLHKNNIRLKIIGDRSRFDEKLQNTMLHAESLTSGNTGLTLTIAANYGGRWDMMAAVQRLLSVHPELATSFTEDDLQPYLSMGDAPEPDLFIRTGGEMRISNFMLWQLAYTELYFTDTLWPVFDRKELEKAIASYQNRERRFGRTSEQLVGVPVQSNEGERRA